MRALWEHSGLGALCYIIVTVRGEFQGGGLPAAVHAVDSKVAQIDFFDPWNASDV